MASDDTNPYARISETPRGFAPLSGENEQPGYLQPEDDHRGPLVLALAIGVLLVFSVVVWNAYRQGIRNADEMSSIPQIASEGQFKTLSDDPGGRAEDFVDREVMHQDGRSPDETITAAVVREEPLPLNGDVSEASLGNDDGLQSKSGGQARLGQNSASQGGRVVGSPGEPVQLAQSDQSRSVPIITNRSELPPNAVVPVIPPPTPVRSKPKPEPTPTPTRTPVQEAKKTTPPPAAFSRPAATPTPSAPRTQTAVTGGYVVQVAAVRTPDAVATEWTKATSRAPELFRNVEQIIQTVDLGTKGIWHRVQVGRFASRTNANSFCSSFKQKGGDCIVKSQ